MFKLVQFTVTIEVDDAGDLDANMMCKAIDEAIMHANNDDTMLPLGSDSMINDWTVSHVSTQPA